MKELIWLLKKLDDKRRNKQEKNKEGNPQSKKKKNGKKQLNLHIALQFIFTILILKAPITTAADDIHKYFFVVFQRK